VRKPEPSVIISVCEDGPLLVRGDFELQEMASGQRIDPQRAVIALCRCGRSRIKPFCDGSHASPSRQSGGG
jgi:CDGSH-type Zn-finger protein